MDMSGEYEIVKNKNRKIIRSHYLPTIALNVDRHHYSSKSFRIAKEGNKWFSIVESIINSTISYLEFYFHKNTH